MRNRVGAVVKKACDQIQQCDRLAFRDSFDVSPQQTSCVVQGIALKNRENKNVPRKWPEIQQRASQLVAADPFGYSRMPRSTSGFDISAGNRYGFLQTIDNRRGSACGDFPPHYTRISTCFEGRQHQPKAHLLLSSEE